MQRGDPVINSLSGWNKMAVIQNLCLFLFCALMGRGLGFFAVIEPHEEECFYERAQQGSKMGLIFEVIEGGFLDIDVKVTGPDNKVIYSGERESSGKYAFAAHMHGVYKYCFGNQMSSMTPKTVMFGFDLAETAQDSDGGHHGKLEGMIVELFSGLASIKHEQEYMEVRERVHRMINDNTNSRVVWWAIFECFLLICMTFGQIYYLKRFFEVRRVI